MEATVPIIQNALPTTIEVDGIFYCVEKQLGGKEHVLKGVHPETREPVVLHLVDDGKDLEVLNSAINIRSRLNGALPRGIMPEFLCGTREKGQWSATNFLPGKSLWETHAKRTALRMVDPAQRVRETVAEAIALLSIMEKYWTPHGLLHRDLKPDNIVVAPEGKMGIIDWEMASTLALEDTMRKIGKHDIMGTTLFLSPEILTEQVWSGACDDFAVGVTTLEGLGLTEWIFPNPNKDGEQILVDKHTGNYRGKITENMQRFRVNALQWEPRLRAMAQGRREERPPWDEALWQKITTLTEGLTRKYPRNRLARAEALDILTRKDNLAEI